MIDTVGNLIDTLRAFRLVPADECQRLLTAAQGRSSNPRPLAKQLVQRGLLTVYQINEIFAGRGKALTIGNYRVLDRLGQGGLSVVYKARHVDVDLTVALKIIRPEVLGNAEGRRQFLQEIEAMARLDHPNIVQFCDADQHESTCYFAMEYIDGIDLGKHIRLSGPAPVHEACDYIRQAALGLQHAHERNLVHRDIKPVNLFLQTIPAPAPRGGFVSAKAAKPARRTRKQCIKILDWGLAGLRCPRGSDAQRVETLAKGLVGTADYLSPEQARNADAVDIRADIYSLGCTFFYLLTGQPPFPDGSLMQKILAHQQAEPPPLRTFRADVPPALEVVLARMLAKNPEDRYQTPAAVALAVMPFTRADGPFPSVAATLGAPRGMLPTAPKDDTPMPPGLAAKAGQIVPHLAKENRNTDAGADTACA